MTFKLLRTVISNNLCLGILATAFMLFAGCSSDSPSKNGDANSPDKAISAALQAAKEKETIAKSAIGATNRAQQIHLLENSTFANSFGALGLSPDFGIDAFYDLQIVSADAGRAYLTASAKQPNFKSFSGVVINANGTTTAKICATKSASQTPPPIDCK